MEVVGDVEYIRDGDIINTVEAVSPVQMIGVEYRWLRKYCADHSPLLHFLLDIITKKFYMKSSSMSFNLLYPVEIRLASYLLSVSYDEADALFLGKLGTADLADAANLIGTSYRHLNRVLQKFAASGLIERSRGGYHGKRPGSSPQLGQPEYLRIGGMNRVIGNLVCTDRRSVGRDAKRV
ncbi:hypothetical protein HMSSN139_41880 [Paenibacillus sp. HMSSN-139]|nr:hypothetical protein HMSSN139_41880 [Paenibacillus sp. HMSSN-139]